MVTAPDVQDIVILDHFKDVLWGNHTYRYCVLCGGAGSGKSHSICQKFCYDFLTQENMQFAVVRATMPALRKSVYLGLPSMVNQLGEWGVPISTWLNKTEATIVNPENNSKMYFIALDDKEKIKSMNLNYVFIEEATELTVDKWRQLDLRLRNDNPYGVNRMYIAYNPISYNNWVVQTFDAKPADDPIKQKTYMHFSNFVRNPYVKREDVESWFATAKENPDFYYTYILGRPGVPRGLIYPNCTFTPYDYWPEEVKNIQPYYGIDWGFVDPMVLVECRDLGNAVYARCLFYYSEKTTSELIESMDKMRISHSAMIYCDSAEKDRRVELEKAGYTAGKGVKNILATISHLKGRELIIDNSGECGELASKEISEYTYQHDPEDYDKFIDKPEDGHDHFCQALGYAVYTRALRDGRVAVGKMNLNVADKIAGFDSLSDTFSKYPMIG